MSKTSDEFKICTIMPSERHALKHIRNVTSFRHVNRFIINHQHKKKTLNNITILNVSVRLIH